MEFESQIVFGPFCFDRTTQRLWQGQREIRLRARTLAVLQFLAEHPGRVISRQEFDQHVWVGTHVSRSVLRVCVWELRQALGDSGATARYIETVGQQGYRFRAQTRHIGTGTSFEVPFVGRQGELAALHSALEHAQRGAPQLVFMTGDPGIGKSTLVRQFLSQIPTSLPIWIGTGQCVEHIGAGEAYLPLLEALGRLGREPGRELLVDALRHTAPLWLVHLPLLVEPGTLEGLRLQVQGLRSERMLRQFVETLSVITRETVVVLLLEDLQWSDSETVATLGYVARCPEHLRLLVLGTYRPAEVIARGHPLRQTVQELVAHRLCQELHLELWTPEQVQEYVVQRLVPSRVSAAVGTMLYRRTDGNVLFVVQLLDHLLQQGWLVDIDGQWCLGDAMVGIEREVPEGLRALLLKQVENLEPIAQQVLEAASVSGSHFTVAEVAAVLQRGEEEVEALCDALARQGAFLVAQEFLTWADGTSTVRYRFRHVLYREVLYERLGMAQRARWHRLLGERLEVGYGMKSREIAGVLALHFARGQEGRRAVQYEQYAAEQALSRSAYTEAEMHCHRGLELLATLPESSDRITQELSLRLVLSIALIPTQGHTAEVLAENLYHALGLCEAVEATTELVPVLVGLSRLFMLRGERAATERLMARARALLSQLDDTASLIQLHMHLGTAETLRGAYAQAEEHQQHVLRLYEPEVHGPSILTLGSDPAVTVLTVSGWRLWLTGWPDQAVDHVMHAQARAQTLAHPLSLMNTLLVGARIRICRGEFPAALAWAQRLVDLGREQGFVHFEAMGTMLQGSVWVQDGEPERSLSLLTTGLAQYRRLVSGASLPFFLAFLAEAHLRLGQIEVGLSVIEEAVQQTETNFARFWTPEVHRLKGELLLAQAGQAFPGTAPEIAVAEACFQQALDIARQQGAKALELRAAISLSRVWLAQDKPDAVQGLLAACYDRFSEGLDTVDLQTAKSVLDRCQLVT